MSQDRTIVPGMEGIESPQNFEERMYTRKGYASTIVPGMMNVAESAEPKAPSQSAPSEVPVVGFMYSISRQGIGEYWTVQIGRNAIGRDADNQIVLLEQTVSGKHASLIVRKKKTTGEIEAVLRDESGKTGLLVNGEEVDLLNGSRVKNGDIISIGQSYTLILILINAEEAGLKVSDNFIPVVEDAEPETSRHQTSFNPYDHSQRGTIAFDGTAGEEPGGTRFM